jgi:hypothetical protein
MSLLTGTKLELYEIVAPLGAGRMGEVYGARYGPPPRCRSENSSPTPEHCDRGAAAFEAMTFRKLSVALLSFALALAVLQRSAAQAPRSVTVQVLAINDFHGNLDPPSGARFILPPRKRSKVDIFRFAMAYSLVLEFARLGSVGDYNTISLAGSRLAFSGQLATKQ